MFDSGLYPLAKSVHLACVTASLCLFATRWTGVLLAQRWPMAARVRHTSVAIDSLLLSAGLSLWLLGHWSLGQSPWLMAKLALLPIYVLLGSWALKRARTRTAHTLFGVLALAVAAQMLGVAVNHHPTGWLALGAWKDMP